MIFFFILSTSFQKASNEFSKIDKKINVGTNPKNISKQHKNYKSYNDIKKVTQKITRKSTNDFTYSISNKLS